MTKLSSNCLQHPHNLTYTYASQDLSKTYATNPQIPVPSCTVVYTTREFGSWLELVALTSNHKPGITIPGAESLSSESRSTTNTIIVLCRGWSLRSLHSLETIVRYRQRSLPAGWAESTSMRGHGERSQTDTDPDPDTAAQRSLHLSAQIDGRVDQS